jgi:hypothetical protein
VSTFFEGLMQNAKNLLAVIGSANVSYRGKSFASSSIRTVVVSQPALVRRSLGGLDSRVGKEVHDHLGSLGGDGRAFGDIC